MKEEIKTNLEEIIKDLQQVQGVEVVSIYADDIEIKFKAGHERTGSELLAAQKILHNYKIFNFVKSEKVDFWSNELKTIKFYLH